MEILQLRYFFESAKTENFAKTAEKYNVPTTSVSASVKRLENELGCKLFDRLSNRIILNDNGKRMMKSLSVIFNELDEAVESLSSINSDTREIKILVRAMRSMIMDFIIEYKTKYPHIKFKTIFDFAKNDFENYDIIIDEKTDRHSEYESFTVFESRIRIKAAKNHPLCGKKLTLKQLKNQPFISMGEHSNMHKILLDACEHAGFTPNIVIQCNDLSCYSKCLAAGIGIGVGREFTLPSNTLSALDVTDFNATQATCVYYKKQDAYGNVEHFLKFLRSKAI